MTADERELVFPACGARLAISTIPQEFEVRLQVLYLDIQDI
jgi:hypothetical protein